MTKEQLKAYRDLKQESEDLKLRIVTLERDMSSPRSPRLDGMPRGGSGENNVLCEQIDKKDELLRLYQEIEAELNAQLFAIEIAIKKLEPRERRLIRLYYMDGLTWEKVAVAMDYSWRQVHRIHGEALEKLREETPTP